ncbi:hypothetical protein RFI_22538 [Reticulomyxa filosa]|uniref:SAP domain-containing protein n=1 Tax=Reticulomyxa filosa TaxID=46433 RepID=X6MP25_RETFI|nr:hypothetical protein RFI_22538 [Reticulomyxa filosa]|eukprot:ETO14830.1 hypothetical protein RFI_22538 [Reticulomyxa filosa]
MSNKRKKPETLAWSDIDLKRLTQLDMRVLLQSRGVTKKDLPTKREKIEELLKTKDIEIELKDELTANQLKAELKMRGLDFSPAKKDVLFQRLRGEIDAQPKKKAKRNPKKKKSRASDLEVHVPLYLPPIDNSKANSEPEGPNVLGVFLHSSDAYLEIFEKFMDDLKGVDEKKYAELAKTYQDGCYNESTLKEIMKKCEKVWDVDCFPKGGGFGKKIVRGFVVCNFFFLNLFALLKFNAEKQKKISTGICEHFLRKYPTINCS